MFASSEQNEESLDFVIFLNRKRLKAISSIKTKNDNETCSKKEYKFLKPFLKALFEDIYQCHKKLRLPRITTPQSYFTVELKLSQS